MSQNPTLGQIRYNSSLIGSIQVCTIVHFPKMRRLFRVFKWRSVEAEKGGGGKTITRPQVRLGKTGQYPILFLECGKVDPRETLLYSNIYQQSIGIEKNGRDAKVRNQVKLEGTGQYCISFKWARSIGERVTTLASRDRDNETSYVIVGATGRDHPMDRISVGSRLHCIPSYPRPGLKRLSAVFQPQQSGLTPPLASVGPRVNLVSEKTGLKNNEPLPPKPRNQPGRWQRTENPPSPS